MVTIYPIFRRHCLEITQVLFGMCFFFRTVVVRQVIAPSAFVDDEDADKYMLPTFGCEQIQ